MPYINRQSQEELDPSINKLVELVSGSGKINYGALEYCIFRMLQQLAEQNMRFDNMNSLVGTIETSKLEFVSRLLKPYEDLKLISSWKEEAEKVTNGTEE